MLRDGNGLTGEALGWGGRRWGNTDGRVLPGNAEPLMAQGFVLRMQAYGNCQGEAKSGFEPLYEVLQTSA